MCVALVVYFLMLGRIAMAFITSGRPAAIGLGLSLMILPMIGIWVMVSTLRAGFAHQRLARNRVDLERLVEQTLWHEIAHHFGMNEREVRAAERLRRMRQLWPH